MVKYEPVFSYNNFNLVANTAIEFRLKDIDDIFGSDVSFDLRELYLEWMTPFGDFSIGKQIISWGAASANNPTDNISPYNYYYLFSEGNEQKEGVLAFNSTIYWGSIKFNAVLIPEHNINIMPFNDPEFAISTPMTINDEMINDINNPFEYGISITMPVKSIDITTSYFSGYDRMMSFFGANLWTMANSNPEFLEASNTIDTVLSYRHTKIFGLGFSTYLNDISIKGDMGYFITDDETINTVSSLYRYSKSAVDRIIKDCEELNEATWDSQLQEVDCTTDPQFNKSQPIDNRAKYYQYTLEMEYSTAYDFTILGQITSHHLLEIGIADSLDFTYTKYLFDPEDHFIPGFGAPNTFMSSTENLLNSRSLSILAQKLFPDQGIGIKYIGIYNLGGSGSINEFGIEYKISNNIHLLGAINKIKGKEAEKNQFSAMEDFSHIRFELKYYY